MGRWVQINSWKFYSRFLVVKLHLNGISHIKYILVLHLINFRIRCKLSIYYYAQWNILVSITVFTRQILFMFYCSSLWIVQLFCVVNILLTKLNSILHLLNCRGFWNRKLVLFKTLHQRRFFLNLVRGRRYMILLLSSYAIKIRHQFICSIIAFEILSKLGIS